MRPRFAKWLGNGRLAAFDGETGRRSTAAPYYPRKNHPADFMGVLQESTAAGWNFPLG